MSTMNLDGVVAAQDTTPATDVAVTTTPTDATATPTTATKTIAIDGPLSTIYTRALAEVYAKDVDGVSTETQSMDVALASAVLLDAKTHPKPANIRNINYAYVTSDDILDKHGVVSAFDSINSALDNELVNSVVVAIEGYTCNPSSNRVTLEEYLFTKGVKVCRSRKAALEYLVNV